MRRFFLFGSFLFTFPLLAEFPAGLYENLSFFPETGDVGGYSLEIKKSGNSWTGAMALAEGELGPREKMKNLSCDTSAGRCDFTWTNYDSTQEYTLQKIPGGAVLSVKGQKSSHLLFENGNAIKLGQDDEYYFATGEAYEKPDKSSKALFTLPPFTKVNNPTFDPGEMVQVEYNNKLVYVESVDHVSVEAVTGDKVRFRKTPSLEGEIVTVLPRWTMIGVISTVAEDDKWVMVTIKGKRGYIAKEFVTGYW